MTLELALRLTEIALSLAILQRGAEHLRRDPWLFAPQMAMVPLVWFGPSMGLVPGLALASIWVFGLAQLARFRGPYNGGADKMLLLGITCVMVARLWAPAAPLALGYLAVQLMLSYFVSGLVKLRNPDWRRGQALVEVFAFSAYPAHMGLRLLARRPRTMALASWAVIGFELAFPLAILSQPSLIIALILAALFHLANAMVFGLNRFFWAWIAVFPSLIWLQARAFG